MRNESIKDVIGSYSPEVKKLGNILGFNIKDIDPNNPDVLVQKGFVTNHSTLFKNFKMKILSQFIHETEVENLNRLLIIIDNQNDARIYRVFPLRFGIRIKKGAKKGEVIFTDNISDINCVEFDDDFFTMPMNNDDQIIWLTSNGGLSGLYFDFSRTSTIKTRKKDLALSYKKMLYSQMYSFLSENQSINELIDKGWFPFINLIGTDFNLLSSTINTATYDRVIDELMERFDRNRLRELSNLWWSNSIFRNKKDVLSAGIEFFNHNNHSGDIACIKIMLTEIEGIIRHHIIKDEGEDRRKQAAFITYLIEKGLSKYPDLGSMGFPNLFKKYLIDNTFDYFNVYDSDIKPNRHSVAHGFVNSSEYTRVRALQSILTIDQLFYLL